MKRLVTMMSAASIATMLYATAGAQAPMSAATGVYTAEQATRGAAVYAEQCSFCHGEALEGSGAMPPLVGESFLANWTGKTVGDLFDKTHATMPATAPGSLTEKQAADVVAYLLQAGAYPAGTTELPASAAPLKQITLDAPPAGGAPAAPGGAAGAGDAAASVAQGVYTEAQAKRGAAVYAEQCSFCHGENLEGSGAMPPLAGASFVQNWTGKTVGDLFEKTHGTMPATAPGSLTEQQTADVLAYMLQAGEYPAGATELAPGVEPLKKITFAP